jgi:hypothetical protein
VLSNTNDDPHSLNVRFNKHNFETFVFDDTTHNIKHLAGMISNLVQIYDSEIDIAIQEGRGIGDVHKAYSPKYFIKAFEELNWSYNSFTIFLDKVVVTRDSEKILSARPSKD